MFHLTSKYSYLVAQGKPYSPVLSLFGKATSLISRQYYFPPNSPLRSPFRFSLRLLLTWNLGSFLLAYCLNKRLITLSYQLAGMFRHSPLNQPARKLAATYIWIRVQWTATLGNSKRRRLRPITVGPYPKSGDSTHISAIISVCQNPQWPSITRKCFPLLLSSWTPFWRAWGNAICWPDPFFPVSLPQAFSCRLFSPVLLTIPYRFCVTMGSIF